MKLPDGTRVPLDMTEGLMTFTARKTTAEELDDQDMEWHDLTSDKEWSPRDMTDDEGGTSFDPTVATLQNIMNSSFIDSDS